MKPAILRRFESVDVTAVSAGFSGVYQWTVNVQTTASTQTIEGRRISNGLLQFKFGPSVHRALRTDERWQGAWTGEGEPDYSKVFITWDKKIYQTDVTLAEVADGLSETDTRLVDQALEIISGSVSAY